MSTLDFTHDPKARSWIPVEKNSPFSLPNLPFGVGRSSTHSTPHIYGALGSFALDLHVLSQAGLLPHSHALQGTSLNALMQEGRSASRAIRHALHSLLEENNATLRDNEALRKKVLLPLEQVEMLLPVQIGDYTDFYSSKEHATNVGTMFRGADNALMPNWTHLPVAYHGRASSVVVSGTPIRRPWGQSKADDATTPTFGPCRLLDFELEVGFFTCGENPLGQPIPVENAEEHIFGLVLVNDWSARDIQKWEYQPLGPFLAKNFATSISPWVVTLDALEPFRCFGPQQCPSPLPYLRAEGPGSFSIDLEVSLRSPTMTTGHNICHSNFDFLYWDMRQQLAHHTVTGCNIRSGDLLASGTISGPSPHSRGSMLELAWRGTEPLQLPNGEKRAFLQDGDEVSMTGWCQGEDYRVGFGAVVGTVFPAYDFSAISPKKEKALKS